MIQKLICLSAGLLIAGSVVAADTPDGKWRGNATAFYSRSTGNTNSNVFATAVDEARATQADKWSVYVSSLYGESQGVKNNDKSRAGARYDYNLSSQLFGFGLGDLERDSIASLSLRTSLGGGLGYHVLQSDVTIFDGLSYSRARMTDGSTNSSAELLIGEESAHKISDTVRFKQKLVADPSLKKTGNSARFSMPT